MNRNKPIRLIALVGSVLASICFAETPAPLMWYTMDEIVDGKIPDKSGNGYDLTAGTGVSVTNFAALGNAVWYDGSANASARSSTKMTGLKSRTVSLWFWRDNHPGPLFSPEQNVNTMPTLLSGLSALNMRFINDWYDASHPELGNRGFTFFCWLGWSTEGFQAYYIAYNNLFVNSCAWNHILVSTDVTGEDEPFDVVVNGKTVSCTNYTFNAKMYLNGQPIFVENGATTTNLCVADNFNIGNIQNSTRPFHGAIDEVRVFNTALTEEQVQAEYARGAANVCNARLLAWFPMKDITKNDDGSFTTPDEAMIGRLKGSVLSCTDHTWVTNGVNGMKALHFDGTATTRALATSPYLLRDATYTCWLHMPTNASIVRIAGQSNNFPRWVMNGTSFSSYFTRGINDTTLQYTVPGSTVETLSQPGVIEKGVWQHLAAVYRYVYDETGSAKARYELWINGKLSGASDAKYSAGSIPKDSTLVLGSGSSSGSATRVFEGDMADFRLYQGALSSNAIERLYLGAAEVSAGADFTVKGGAARLEGYVAPKAGSFQVGYSGRVGWTQVSGPATAEFTRPANAVTEATLPAEGAYVFRLATTTPEGIVASDDVEVTRAAAWDGNHVPVVTASADTGTIQFPAGVILTASATDADGDVVRLSWAKKAGPGGVWFTPQKDGTTRADFSAAGSYELACIGTDGANETTNAVMITVTAGTTAHPVTDNLLVHYPAKPGVSRAKIAMEAVSGTSSITFDSTTRALAQGVSGYGFRAYPPYGAVDTGLLFPEANANGVPADEWRTVSAWVYRDTSDDTPVYAPCWFSVQLTLRLCYGQHNNPGMRQFAGTVPGFSIAQRGLLGRETYLNYPAPSYPVTDRWLHVCAVVNRHNTLLSKFYLDGEELNASSWFGDTYPNDTSKYGDYANTAQGGRFIGDRNMHIGSQPKWSNDADINGPESSIVSNTTTGVVGYRIFPGVVDDVRVYGRELSPGEIRWLAQHPETDFNREPYVEAALASRRLAKKRAGAAIGTGIDDGKPVECELSYAWSVAEGDAAQVVFTTPHSASTAVTANKVGHYVFVLAVSDGERTTYSSPLSVDVDMAGTIIVLM